MPRWQEVVIDRRIREALLIVEEVPMRMAHHVRLFRVRHRDVRMLIEEPMQRASPSLLHASDDEIEVIDLLFVSAESEHAPGP
jgi:hypothetical protein